MLLGDTLIDNFVSSFLNITYEFFNKFSKIRLLWKNGALDAVRARAVRAVHIVRPRTQTPWSVSVGNGHESRVLTQYQAETQVL